MTKKEEQIKQELIFLFEKLKLRIHFHRNECEHWKRMKPCSDCHYDCLTAIEQKIKELK